MRGGDHSYRLELAAMQNSTKPRASKFPDSDSMMKRKISAFHLFGLLNLENQGLTMHIGLA